MPAYALTRWIWQSKPSNERGFVLAMCLPLLGTLAILSAGSLASATLDVRSSANHEYRERAYQAASFAIETALASVDLRTSYTLSAPLVVPAGGETRSIPGLTHDGYGYRLYFLRSGDPGELEVVDGAALKAFHFVIESTGYSARGAKDVHVQGFYVLRREDWTTDEPCRADPAACDALTNLGPVRTYWLQPDSE